MGVVFLIVIIVIAVWVLASCVRIVPQAYAVILERLGAYQATWSTGIHFKVPFIERVARKVNLKEQVVDFPPQPVITKDNVTMQIDTVVFFQITDPKLYTYGVENPIMAIENLSATTLRNIIGDMELDETLTSRETINTKMRASLDEATDPWGIKVNRVELKNIIPPAAIQDAMEKQMKAERERREAILIAEGQKKSTILVAEGKKQSAILDAEAEKQAAILRAEAQKERMIKEAEGQAEAVLKVQNANAEGIRMIREAGADEAVLTLKSLEAFAKAADGKATKIIIPSDIQGIAGPISLLSSSPFSLFLQLSCATAVPNTKALCIFSRMHKAFFRNLIAFGRTTLHESGYTASPKTACNPRHSATACSLISGIGNAPAYTARFLPPRRRSPTRRC